MATIIRGDTTLFEIPLVDRQNQPYPLHGCTVWVTVKTGPDVPDDDALYGHWLVVDMEGAVLRAKGMQLGDGGADAGIVVQELTPEESQAFATGSYTYDVQVMTALGRIYTPIRGLAETVEPDWTRAIVPPEVTP